MTEPIKFRRNRILGVTLTPISAKAVCEAIRDRKPNAMQLILNHNLHSVYLYHRFGWFRDFYASADLIVVDGWPVLRTLDWRLPASLRIGSTDWLEELLSCDEFESDLRIFVLGSDPATNQEAISHIASSPNVSAVVGHHGYFAETSLPEILDQILNFSPDLVLVGMGMPRQEEIVRAFEGRVHASIATVGGAIDYLAGASPLSPRVFGRLGLEWAWRLAHAPRRLGRRYLVEPFELALLLAAYHAKTFAGRIRGR